MFCFDMFLMMFFYCDLSKSDIYCITLDFFFFLELTFFVIMYLIFEVLN